MAGMTTVMAKGNIVRDLELRTIPNEKATQVLDFTLAVDDGWGDNKKSCFFDVTIFGKKAEVIEQYCRKGSTICVNGRLSMDTWESDGQKRSKVKIVANDFDFCDKPDENQQSNNQPQVVTQGAGEYAPPANTEEIPF